MWFLFISAAVKILADNDTCRALKFVSFVTRSKDAQFMVSTALMSAVLSGSEFWLNGDITHVEEQY